MHTGISTEIYLSSKYMLNIGKASPSSNASTHTRTRRIVSIQKVEEILILHSKLIG